MMKITLGIGYLFQTICKVKITYLACYYRIRVEIIRDLINIIISNLFINFQFKLFEFSFATDSWMQPNKNVEN